MTILDSHLYSKLKEKKGGDKELAIHIGISLKTRTRGEPISISASPTRFGTKFYYATLFHSFSRKETDSNSHNKSQCHNDRAKKLFHFIYSNELEGENRRRWSTRTVVVVLSQLLNINRCSLSTIEVKISDCWGREDGRYFFGSSLVACLCDGACGNGNRHWSDQRIEDFWCL